MLLTPGIATVTICPSDPEKPIRGQHNQHKHRTRHCVTAADRHEDDWYRRTRGCIGPDVVLFLCHTAVNEVNLLRISIHCEEYDGVQHVSQHKQGFMACASFLTSVGFLFFLRQVTLVSVDLSHAEGAL